MSTEKKHKIIISENNVTLNKDKFVCYGTYDPENPRCDGRYCPWSKDNSCQSHTTIRRMHSVLEEFRTDDNSKSEP